MPTCIRCNYDLAGIWKADGQPVTCPECGEAWSELIERSIIPWPGWRRYLLETIAIPGLVSAVVLAAHVAGALLPRAFKWLAELAWALTLTPVLIALVTCIALPAYYTRAPRVRRPSGWTMLAACLAVSAGVQGAFLVLAVVVGGR
ncbi:MAG: hypothetical protein HBSAPP03_13110 [Phycisphaerae bacterium]|nr:MAG: hypothetical protein HBSAPP03_13110 [Phycisphaerae bacterium]